MNGAHLEGQVAYEVNDVIEEHHACACDEANRARDDQHRRLWLVRIGLRAGVAACVHASVRGGLDPLSGVHMQCSVAASPLLYAPRSTALLRELCPHRLQLFTSALQLPALCKAPSSCWRQSKRGRPRKEHARCRQPYRLAGFAHTHTYRAYCFCTKLTWADHKDKPCTCHPHAGAALMPERS